MSIVAQATSGAHPPGLPIIPPEVRRASMSTPDRAVYGQGKCAQVEAVAALVPTIPVRAAKARIEAGAPEQYHPGQRGGRRSGPRRGPALPSPGG